MKFNTNIFVRVFA